MIAYDYVLTVPREARLFWKPKVNAASILFFVNRYLALVYYVALGYYRSLVLPYPVSRSTVTEFFRLIFHPRSRWMQFKSGPITDVQLVAGHRMGLMLGPDI